MTFRFTTFASFAFLAATLSGHATENDRLTREERDRVGHLYSKVIQDKQVQEARQTYEQATKHYHDVLRHSMIQRDPKVRSALTKIRINPSLLAEAIWEKRNKDILRNLHLPVRRLEREDRKRWDSAMGKLQQKEITKAFSKRLERNYRQQAKLRKEQIQLMSDFKKQARRTLVAVDPGLKPILEKLDRPVTLAPNDKGSKNPSPVEEAKALEQDSELVPPMPVPMPAEPDEC